MKEKILLLTVSISAMAGIALAQQGEISYRSTEVAPGILMLEGVGGFAGGNLGILTGNDGVVLIDDGMLPLFDTMQAAIRDAVGKNVDFVVNTHAHGDHVGGNENLSKAGATILAHDKLRARLAAEGVTGPDGQISANEHWLPDLTFSDAMTLHINGHRTHVFHVANAHTDGDAVVHFPDADVIHTGDVLFNGLFPYIDLDSGGTVDGYIAAQERILLLAGADTKIIPGHGGPATKRDLEAARDMLVAARDRIRKRVAAGESDDAIVAANPLADYAADWDWGFINAERMTRTILRDARARD